MLSVSQVAEVKFVLENWLHYLCMPSIAARELYHAPSLP